MLQCKKSFGQAIPSLVRYYASTSKHSSISNNNNDNYKLTCGLEIHAQLMTPQKLFSSQSTGFHAPPNSQVSYYDASLPGTQPILNPNNVYLALRAAVALGCTVRSKFSFDRKHYFYGDQPTGYQVTQHFEPYAMDGLLTLYSRDLDDGKSSSKKAKSSNDNEHKVEVRIKQIQIEQDTGKSTYIDDTANIDLNRSNHCLIELVTEPDIPNPESAGVFVKKLQQLLSYLGVCTGELESGAMRVDVNVSVSKRKNSSNKEIGDDEWEMGERCEIKNLSTTSAVVHAIRAEYSRQIKDMEDGKVIERETRGWDGRKTWKLRSKEDGVDYRYMPDPEVLPVILEKGTMEKVKQELPELPDEIFKRLLEAPYNVPLRDARTLMTGNTEAENFDENGESSDGPEGLAKNIVLGEIGTYPIVEYYKEVFEYLEKHNAKTKLAANWIVHTLLGELNVLGRTSFVPGSTVLPALQLAEMLRYISEKKLTTASGKIILKHLLQDPAQSASASIVEIMDKFELSRAPTNTSEQGQSQQDGSENSNDGVHEAVGEICSAVVEKFPKIVEQIQSGKKPKSIQFLIGQVMRETQGRVDPQVVEGVLREVMQKS